MPITAGDNLRSSWNKDAVEVIAVTDTGVRSAQIGPGNYLVYTDAQVAFKRGDSAITTTFSTGNVVPASAFFWINITAAEEYIFFITSSGASANVRIMDPGR